MPPPRARPSPPPLSSRAEPPRSTPHVPAPAPASAPRDARRRRERRVGRALTAAAVVVVAVLTLVPMSAPPMEFPPWCLVCGDIGGADVLSNVVLFLPLGVGLALSGVPWRRAVMVGFLLSLVVEVAQRVGVPGRTGTLSDLLTNTLGTALGLALGATWRSWLRPRRRTAVRLATAAAAAWVGVQAFGAWLYGVPGTPPGPPSPTADSIGRPYGWFAGRVSAASVNGIATPHAGSGAVRVMAAAGAGSRAEATVDLSDPRRGLVPLVLVADSAGRERLLVGQLRRDAVAIAGERPLRLRLRRPFARVVEGMDVLDARIEQPTAFPAPRYVAGGVRGDTVWVQVRDASGRTRDGAVRLSPALVWSAFAPFARPGTPAGDVAQALWLAALLAPMGYWCAWMGRARARTWAAAVPLLAAAAAVGTWGVAALGDFRTVAVGDWLAASAGGVAALLVGAAARRWRP